MKRFLSFLDPISFSERVRIARAVCTVSPQGKIIIFLDRSQLQCTVLLTKCYNRRGIYKELQRV